MVETELLGDGRARVTLFSSQAPTALDFRWSDAPLFTLADASISTANGWYATTVDAELQAPSSETLLLTLTCDEEQARRRGEDPELFQADAWMAAQLLRSSTPPELLEREAEPEPAPQRTCKSGVK